jgi:hypothetical protein
MKLYHRVFLGGIPPDPPPVSLRSGLRVIVIGLSDEDGWGTLNLGVISFGFVRLSNQLQSYGVDFPPLLVAPLGILLLIRHSSVDDQETAKLTRGSRRFKRSEPRSLRIWSRKERRFKRSILLIPTPTAWTPIYSLVNLLRSPPRGGVFCCSPAYAGTC